MGDSIRSQIRKELREAQTAQNFEALKARRDELNTAQGLTELWASLWLSSYTYVKNTMDFLEKIYNAADLTNHTKEWEKFVLALNKAFWKHNYSWHIDDGATHNIRYNYKNGKWNINYIFKYGNYYDEEVVPKINIRYGRRVLNTDIAFDVNFENKLSLIADTDDYPDFPEGYQASDAEKLVAEFKQPTLDALEDCAYVMKKDFSQLIAIITEVYSQYKKTFTFPTINIKYDVGEDSLEMQGDYLVKNGLAVIA